jgi:hypothetical protein
MIITLEKVKNVSQETCDSYGSEIIKNGQVRLDPLIDSDWIESAARHWLEFSELKQDIKDPYGLDPDEQNENDTG